MSKAARVQSNLCCIIRAAAPGLFVLKDFTFLRLVRQLTIWFTMPSPYLSAYLWLDVSRIRFPELCASSQTPRLAMKLFCTDWSRSRAAANCSFRNARSKRACLCVCARVNAMLLANVFKR